jgi:hypothetical protein
LELHFGVYCELRDIWKRGEKKLCKVGVLCNVTEYTVRSLLYYRLLFILGTSLFLLHILINGQEKHGSRASRIYLPAS